MNIFVVVGHPDSSSFSHAIAQTAIQTVQRSGHAVMFHDLYAEAFHPVISAQEARHARSDDPLVEQHCRELALADGIIVVHPNWWGQPPAILKGWIDRVLRPGVAYDWGPADRGEGVPMGLLHPAIALVFNTANTPWEREITVFGNPLDTVWRNCVFGLCGVETIERRVYGPMATSTADERGNWLHEVETLVRQCYPSESTEQGVAPDACERGQIHEYNRVVRVARAFLTLWSAGELERSPVSRSVHRVQ